MEWLNGTSDNVSFAMSVMHCQLDNNLTESATEIIRACVTEIINTPSENHPIVKALQIARDMSYELNRGMAPTCSSAQFFYDLSMENATMSPRAPVEWGVSGTFLQDLGKEFNLTESRIAAARDYAKANRLCVEPDGMPESTGCIEFFTRGFIRRMLDKKAKQLSLTIHGKGSNDSESLGDILPTMIETTVTPVGRAEDMENLSSVGTVEPELTSLTNLQQLRMSNMSTPLFNSTEPTFEKATQVKIQIESIIKDLITTTTTEPPFALSIAETFTKLQINDASITVTSVNETPKNKRSETYFPVRNVSEAIVPLTTGIDTTGSEQNETLMAPVRPASILLSPSLPIVENNHTSAPVDSKTIIINESATPISQEIVGWTNDMNSTNMSDSVTSSTQATVIVSDEILYVTVPAIASRKEDLKQTMHLNSTGDVNVLSGELTSGWPHPNRLRHGEVRLYCSQPDHRRHY